MRRHVKSSYIADLRRARFAAAPCVPEFAAHAHLFRHGLICSGASVARVLPSSIAARLVDPVALVARALEEEKRCWFKTPAVPDLTPSVFGSCFTQFTIPSKEDR